MESAERGGWGSGYPAGTKGSNSLFATLTAIGGGAGAGYNVNAVGIGGSAGGNGAGGGKRATYTPEQGNDGGNGDGSNAGGGGGGANQTGFPGVAGVGGNGGGGITSSISGVATAYAGGGGGGTRTGNGAGGTGGAGGGGAGGTGGNPGVNGTPNTGGGGGGGGYSPEMPGGTGGSGIVIVRFFLGGPVVSNVSAVVEESGVTLNGYLVSTGKDANVSAAVYWGTNDAGNDLDGWACTNPFPDFVEVGPLTTNVTPTVASVRHYYRFFASNSIFYSWAEPSGLFAAIGPPVVNNDAGALNESHSSAILRGEATGGNPTPEVWIFWGAVNQGESKAWEHAVSIGTASNRTFETTVNDLTFAQRYYYICYASNSYGWAWSAVKTFSGNDGTVHFVDADGAAPESPYLNWANAATSIQEAVDACAASDTVWVADGTYYITNEIVLAKPVTVQSVWGASSTIVSRAASGTNLPHHRIFLITTNATLDGFTVQNGYFYGNTNGAGIYMTKGTVQNCIIYTNVLNGVWGQSRYGAGVYMTGGTLQNCTIVSNASDYISMGGGICHVGGIVKSNRVAYNSVTTGSGISTAAGTIQDCLIEFNSGYSGGGIGSHVNYPSTVISNCLIRFNTSSTGGGVSMPDLTVMVDCTIVSNTASTGGGGIYSGMNYNTVDFKRCEIGWNQAPFGAGIYLVMGNTTAYGTYNFENCLIRDNIGPHAVYLSEGRNWARFRNCTIAAFQPYGVFTPGPFFTNWYSGEAIVYPLFQNTIIYNFQTNIFSTNEPLLSILLTNSFTNCCSPQLTEPGHGNVSGDPRFEKAAEGKYRLMKNSPCAGTGTTNVLSRYQTDLESVAWGEAVNMGCYKTLIPVQGTVIVIR